MTKQDALEFWEEFLAMSCGADADSSVVNPAVAFTNNAKEGRYDYLSEDEYRALLNRVDEFSYFWNDHHRPAASEVLLRALRTTDIPKPVIAEIAAKLAECSITTRYGSPWLSGADRPRILGTEGLRDYICAGPSPDSLQDHETELAPESMPREIYESIRKYVYGQDEACRAAAIVMYKHLNGQRTNALFHGPTGSGKSEIWRSLARMFPGKIRMVDFSRVAGDGWIGSMHMRDVFDGVDRRQLANEGVIIVLDEADKIVAERATNNRGFNYNDVVQNQLLKILDGDVVEFGQEKDRDPFTVDCAHVSVVMLGAFERLVSARGDGPKPIGFGSAGTAATKDESAPVGYDELVKAGMRRELAGRVQLIAQVRALDLAGYESILRGRVLANPDVAGGLKMSMDDKDVTALASAAMDAKLGVRWMSSQVTNAVDSLIFDHPGIKECVVKYPPCRAEPVEKAPDKPSPDAGTAPRQRGRRKRKKEAETENGTAAEAAM